MELDTQPIMDSSGSCDPEEAIIGGGIIGAGLGLAGAEAADSVFEGVVCVVAGAVLGAGIPAGVWGIYKGVKYTWRLLKASG